MKKNITKHLINARKEDASLNIYFLESILIGIIFVFAINLQIQPTITGLTLYLATAITCVVLILVLSKINPLCEDDAIYEKASNSFLLVLFLGLMSYIQSTRPSPMTFEDAVFILIIAVCIIAYWYYILSYPFEFMIFCLFEFIIDKFKTVMSKISKE
jgi:hypothetical protein